MRCSPSIDLGYASYTDDTPLTPKTYWRYLGFYFDRQLRFHEHVRFYSTKALTSVMAMGMLGNSVRGLQAKERRVLYRACVLPIAMYGHCLWYYNGAPVKGGHEDTWHNAAQSCYLDYWGVPHVPTGGVQAIAGLLPIHLHIQKLSWRASFRTATLSATHPARSLMGAEYRGDAEEHPPGDLSTHTQAACCCAWIYYGWQMTCFLPWPMSLSLCSGE